MSRITIYKKDNGEFVFDGYVTPAGTWRKKIETSPGAINFREVGAPEDLFPQAIYISDILDKNGNPYASIAAFDTEMDGFFVKAVAGGGSVEVVPTSASGTASVALAFGKATVHANTLTSADVLTLTLGATASTKLGEYLYEFKTGATAPTITFPPECKESIVINSLKKYLISFVRVSSTEVFTFYKEEAI